MTNQNSVTILLSRPADIAGVQTETLTMREPTVNDQLVASYIKGNDAEKEITLFSNLLGILPTDFRKLPLKDLKKIQEAYSGFLD